jgi:hypothetical protein
VNCSLRTLVSFIINCRAYGRNVQTRDGYVALSNIEYYKFHNYGHIAQNCRIVIDPPMKENIDVRYMKVWIRNEKQEEQVNENQVLEIVLTRFAAVKDHDESTVKEEDVRIQEENEEEYVRIREENEKDVKIQEEDEKENDESIEEEEHYSASKRIFFEPFILETPGKYEY